MKRILVATDGSEAAKLAEFKAAELAKQLDCGLTLLYVFEPPVIPPGRTALPSEALSDYEAWGSHFISERAKTLSRPGLDIATRVIVGSAAESIAKEAEDSEIEMVVVGSRGRNAVARLLLGSVATRLGHICPKPLLIVRTEFTPGKKS